MGDRVQVVAGRKIPEHSKMEQAMNDEQVYIRVATGNDREKLRAMFARSSPESIYKRFHVPYPEVPERMVALMLAADHHDEESLVAVAQEKVVGHAMYVRFGNHDEAEMAIIVEDQWQARGIGKLLLSELGQRARLRGIETFVGEVLGTNRPMLGLAAMFAGAGYAIEDSVNHVRMPLRTPDPAVQTVPPVRRAA